MKLFKCVLILSLTGGINSTPLEGFGFSLVPSLGISGTTFFEPNKYPSGYTTIIRGPFNLGKVELDDGEAWGVKTDITLAPNLAFGQYSIRDQSVTPKWNFLGVGVELNIANLIVTEIQKGFYSDIDWRLFGSISFQRMTKELPIDLLIGSELFILEINNSDDDIRRWNLIGSTYFQYDPLEWLSLKTTFSAGLENYRRGRSWGAMTNRGVSNNDLPSADMERRENFNYTWDNQFNINHTLNDVHDFNLLGLYSLYSNRTESSFVSSRNMPFDTDFYNIGSGEQSTFNLGTNFIKQTLVSYALRLNYSFKDKYLLTLSNRWDGSSLLSQENRWDSFPSGAIAWRIIEEPFMQEQNSISNLKLRLSYGFTGNNIIDPYSTLNTLDQQTFYDFNGATANGWLPASIANSQLGWEKTREVNFGVDFGFLKNRITGSVDLYDRLSDDLLLQQQLPLETGWESISANVGSVSNKGVEIALTTRNVQTSNITWTTSFTFTKNTNSIESIYGQDEMDDIGNNLFIGESIDAIYNYKFTGIWQADEAAEAEAYGMEEGQEKLLDVNGDGRYTPEGDRIILGSSNPDWSGSFFSSLKVGNFDLSTSVITNQGVFVYSPFHSNFADTRDRGRQKLDINWYVPENNAGLPARASNTHPQPRNEGSFWRNDEVGYYKDASFVKVKNIALGYTFGENMNENLGINKLRVYGNVLNPFVFTDYEGYDPEWASAGLGIGRVSSITYQLGFSLKF